MKILLDVCLSPDWVSFFGSRNIESVHWSSIGHCTAKDIEIFRYAQEHGFVVFTHDLDFGTILAHCRASAPSVIQARVQDVSPEAIGESVCSLILQFQIELCSGAIVTLLSERTKVRILPL